LVRQFLAQADRRPETSDRGSGKDNCLDKKLLQLAGWLAILTILVLSIVPSGAAKTCVAHQINAKCRGRSRHVGTSSRISQ
jgi:hypothetical protein